MDSIVFDLAEWRAFVQVLTVYVAVGKILLVVEEDGERELEEKRAEEWEEVSLLLNNHKNRDLTEFLVWK
jgi:hypothetical protein